MSGRNRSSQPQAAPSVETQPLSIKSLAVLIGSVLVPMVGFGALAQSTLGDIRMELTLLRHDVNGLKADNLEADHFASWVQVFSASNPQLVVPPPFAK